ncbi:hypothetical protein OQA88_56 [Cercophora sp. LCS_1]
MAEEPKTIKKTSKSLEIGTATNQAPAVTHETIKPAIHEVQQEVVNREIHTYEHIHRIQPVKDVQVLPVRHYVADKDENLVEMSEEEIAKLEERGVLAGQEKQN